MGSNVKEAEECYARAEKALKTGMTKWTPDYEIAANEYSKAATFFRTAKMPEKAIEANLKAAHCYEKSKSFFSAAKCYEQSGILAKDGLKDWDQTIKHYEKACSFYREHGVPDTAALTYNKGASMLEPVRPEKAAQWYGYAHDTVLNEDRYLQASEYANKAVRMYLKLKKFDEAIRWSEAAFESYITGEEPRSAGRQVVIIVILNLARGDQVAAQKAYEANRGHIHPDEQWSLDRLFQGLDNFDNDAIHSALKSPFIGSLDNEIVKVVRDLLIKYEPKKTDGGSSSAPVGDDQIEDDEAGAML